MPELISDEVSETIGNYQKMVNFIKHLVKDLDDDEFIFDRESEIEFKDTGDPLFKSEFLCVLIKMKCQEFLKEIGED